MCLSFLQETFRSHLSLKLVFQLQQHYLKVKKNLFRVTIFLYTVSRTIKGWSKWSIVMTGWYRKWVLKRHQGRSPRFGKS